MQETWGKGEMRREIGRAAWGASPRGPSISTLPWAQHTKIGFASEINPPASSYWHSCCFLDTAKRQTYHHPICFFVNSHRTYEKKKKVQWHQQPPKNPTKIPTRISKNLANSFCSIIIHARKKRNHLCKKKIHFEVWNQDLGLTLTLTANHRSQHGPAVSLGHLRRTTHCVSLQRTLHFSLTKCSYSDHKTDLTLSLHTLKYLSQGQSLNSLSAA